MSQANSRQFKVGEEKRRSVGGVTKSPFSPPESFEKDSAQVAKHSPEGNSGEPPNKKKIGPSGSRWGLRHLNWLHILLEVGCDWKDLFSPESELSQSSKIATCVKKELGEDWISICNTDHANSNSIYAHLKDLVTQVEVDDDFNTATQSSTGPITPFSVKLRSVQDSITPQQHRQITLDPQRT